LAVQFTVNSKSNTNSLSKPVATTNNGSQPTGECGIFQRLGSMRTTYAKCIYEIKSRFVMAKAAFNKKNVHLQI
jgi:hypothetical protein